MKYQRMKYQPAYFCEHANEVPKGFCTCPRDCSCREHMCNLDKALDYESNYIEKPISSFVNVGEENTEVIKLRMVIALIKIYLLQIEDNVHLKEVEKILNKYNIKI